LGLSALLLASGAGAVKVVEILQLHPGLNINIQDKVGGIKYKSIHLGSCIYDMII
jgi:hypothetical protein